MLIHSDPNSMNSIVYHLTIERYSMKTLHWYFPWATALHLYNMTGRGEKLQQLHCYHPFSDSLDIYLTKNHYENYSPKMVPIAKIWGSGSWTKWIQTPTVILYAKIYVEIRIMELCVFLIAWLKKFAVKTQPSRRHILLWGVRWDHWNDWIILKSRATKKLAFYTKRVIQMTLRVTYLL